LALSDPESAPPGWYADPSRRHERRYWDGARWTDQIADLQGRIGSDPELPKRPWWRASWDIFWQWLIHPEAGPDKYAQPGSYWWLRQVVGNLLIRLLVVIFVWPILLVIGAVVLVRFVVNNFSKD
jgi:hypothetical protein